MTIQIGLIGDFSSEVTAHIAIPKAIAMAADNLKLDVAATWLPTKNIYSEIERLSTFHGLWCVPASPYASMDGALAAIRFARENDRPFLGTCGGFQHALIEYARNVLGYEDAEHAESNPSAAMSLIAPLSCSLAEAKGTIKFKEDSKISRIYGKTEVVEQYNCKYGVNERYRYLLESGAMKISGVDAANEPRSAELSGHPFFIATLFQPERSALSGIVHPLIRAYIQSASSVRMSPDDLDSEN